MVFPGFRFLAPLALARGPFGAVLAEALAPGEPTTDDSVTLKKTQLEDSK